MNVPVDIEDLSINSNQAVQFSGIEIMNLIDEGNELPTLEQSDLHHAILNSLYTHFFKFENILQLPENFENAEYVIQTEVPFTKLVEIYRNDDYNLTNVDLNELVQLEMLPIVDKPTIQFIVEEAVASGIEDILIVTGKSKRPIEDHFDSNIELEEHLRENGLEDLLDIVNDTTNVNLFFVRQAYPKGLGHAVLQAKAFIGDEPFIVMLGDDVMQSEVPLTKQLINVYDETHASNIAVMEVPYEDTNKYGVIAPEREYAEGIYNVERFVEKPKKMHQVIWLLLDATY